jgi:hypothetical protein
MVYFSSFSTVPVPVKKGKLLLVSVICQSIFILNERVIYSTVTLPVPVPSGGTGTFYCSIELRRSSLDSISLKTKYDQDSLRNSLKFTLQIYR